MDGPPMRWLGALGAAAECWSGGGVKGPGTRRTEQNRVNHRAHCPGVGCPPHGADEQQAIEAASEDRKSSG